MGSTIKQRLRRYNGADYDTIHLETETACITDMPTIPGAASLNFIDNSTGSVVSAVTASYMSHTIQLTKDGTLFSAELPTFGNWTITYVADIYTRSISVSISGNGLYTINYNTYRAYPLNTDQLTLGMNTVYFTAYPDLKWCVDHLDGDYAYLGLYNCSERTKFSDSGSITYSGSTIATKCTTFLNNTIPNVADYLESVTVNGVTNKVFIPSYKMFSGTAAGDWDTNDPTFSWISASANNRKACVSNWSTINNWFWLSSRDNSGHVWSVYYSNGGFNGDTPTNSAGFRPAVKVRYRDCGSEVDDIEIIPPHDYTYSTTDLTPGTSELATGNLYFVYE